MKLANKIITLLESNSKKIKDLIKKAKSLGHPSIVKVLRPLEKLNNEELSTKIGAAEDHVAFEKLIDKYSKAQGDTSDDKEFDALEDKMDAIIDIRDALGSIKQDLESKNKNKKGKASTKIVDPVELEIGGAFTLVGPKKNLSKAKALKKKADKAMKIAHDGEESESAQMDARDDEFELNFNDKFKKLGFIEK